MFISEGNSRKMIANPLLQVESNNRFSILCSIIINQSARGCDTNKLWIIEGAYVFKIVSMLTKRRHIRPQIQQKGETLPMLIFLSEIRLDDPLCKGMGVGKMPM